MVATPYSNNINEYLEPTSIIDYTDQSIAMLAAKLWRKSKDKNDYIRLAYEYVRDKIQHSADANRLRITCRASEVLAEGHGVCFAKAHLLVALLRCKGIPAGMCYQKLILDDDTTPVLVLHGLCGVYIEEEKKWIRIDPRGNKEGVDAQFSLVDEQLAFPVRPEKGEEDYYTVYPQPDANVANRLMRFKSREELWADLPQELAK